MTFHFLQNFQIGRFLYIRMDNGIVEKKSDIFISMPSSDFITKLHYSVIVIVENACIVFHIFISFIHIQKLSSFLLSRSETRIVEWIQSTKEVHGQA